MPASILAELLARHIKKFLFLCEIPALQIDSCLHQENCAICQEPYRNNGWELGGTLHRPVALPCRHVFGFQCLARWVLSRNFNNHCPLCRVQIIDLYATRVPSSRPLVFSLTLFETLTVMANNGISPAQKGQLLGFMQNCLRDEMATTDRMPIDQVMAAWEEFLNIFSDESAAPVARPPATPAAPVVQNRQPVNAPAIIRPAPNHERANTRAVARPAPVVRNRRSVSTQTLARPPAPLVNFSLTRTQFHIALFFSAAIFAHAPFSVRWDKSIDRLDTFTAMAGLISVYILNGAVFLFLTRFEVPWKWTVMCLGATLGVVYCILVRHFEMVLIGWWTDGKYAFDYGLAF